MPPARAALYAATAGVLATTGFAIVRRPPSLEWSALLLAGYTALLLCGVLVLRLRVVVAALVERPRGARGVALAFDDCPHPRWPPRFPEILAGRGVRATFFVVGLKVE